MAAVTAPRFMGIPQFEKCLNGARMTADGFDDGGDLVVDEPNDPSAVTAIQTALAEFHPVIAVTGVYDEQTAEAVRLFKTEQNLALPPGLAQHDGVTGPGTAGRLNQLFTPAPPGPDPQLHYTDRKSFYTNIALGRTHDNAHPEWLPEAGYAANRPRIVDVYAYYRDLYLARPEQFLWAGLGHMAGGAVVGGLDSDPGLISQPIMVRIGRDIFFDLAWLHEAFLDRPDTVVELAGLHDQFNTYPTYDALDVPGHAPGVPARSYKAAWEKIVSGDPQKVAEGNRDLLENEQRSIIQPHYDLLRTFLFAGMPTPFTNEIHPYHRAFIVEVPAGDILVFSDRWAWVSAAMFQKWGEMGSAERTRLVSLPFDDICRGSFGVPGRLDLLPPGGPP